jgi:capsular polysaccharide biosynthesis protein
MSTQLEPDASIRLEPPVEYRFSPRISVASAVRRHPVVAIAPVVVLLVIASVVSYARTPTYTADTRLAVGRLDASTPSSLAGFTQVTQTLADRYARSVRAEDVIDAAATELGVSRAQVRDRISAAPIPETPIFRIRAQAGTAGEAVTLANAVSESLVRQSKKVAASGGPDSRRFLRRYRRAALELAALQAEVNARRTDVVESPSQATLDALTQARSEATVAKLRVSTLQTAYQMSRQSAGSAALVEIVERAVQGRSDRSRVMQLLLFIGAVVGVAIGIALALLLAHRRARLLHQ